MDDYGQTDFGPPPPEQDGPPSPFGNMNVPPDPMAAFSGPPAMAAPPPSAASPSYMLDPRDAHALLYRALQIDPGAGLPPQRPPEARLQVAMNNVVGSIGRLFHNEALIQDAEQHRKAWEHIDEQQRALRLDAAVGQAQGEARAQQDARDEADRRQKMRLTAIDFYLGHHPEAHQVYENGQWRTAGMDEAIPRVMAQIFNEPAPTDGKVMRFVPEIVEQAKDEAKLTRQYAHEDAAAELEDTRWSHRFGMQVAEDRAREERAWIRSLGTGGGKATILPPEVAGLERELGKIQAKYTPAPTKEDRVNPEAYQQRISHARDLNAAPEARTATVRAMGALAARAAENPALLHPSYTESLLNKFLEVGSVPGADLPKAKTALKSHMERLLATAEATDAKYRKRGVTTTFRQDLEATFVDFASRLSAPQSIAPTAPRPAPAQPAIESPDGEPAIGGDLQ